MFQNFFKHVDIDPRNAHILDGNASDLEEECNNYEKMITEAGGIRLFIGGRIKDIIKGFQVNISSLSFGKHWYLVC